MMTAPPVLLCSFCDKEVLFQVMVGLVIKRGSDTDKGLCCNTALTFGKQKKNAELKQIVVRKGKEMLEK